jgi:hypothetical protein
MPPSTGAVWSASSGSTGAGDPAFILRHNMMIKGGPQPSANTPGTREPEVLAAQRI